MTTQTCPTPEELFERLSAGDAAAEEHLGGCTACATMLEAHRELEKDLYRIQDPLPPVDLVPAIMARIEAAPIPLQREVFRVLAIAGPVVLALLALFFVPDPAARTNAGGGVASTLLGLRTLVTAMAEATIAVWNAAALPLTLGLGAVLMLSILGLWRFSATRLSEASA